MRIMWIAPSPVSSVTPVATATDLAHGRFGRLRGMLGHIETLLGVAEPGKCLLA